MGQVPPPQGKGKSAHSCCVRCFVLYTVFSVVMSSDLHVWVHLVLDLKVYMFAGTQGTPLTYIVF